MLSLNGIRAHHHFPVYFNETDEFQIMQIVTDRYLIFIWTLQALYINPLWILAYVIKCLPWTHISKKTYLHILKHEDMHRHIFIRSCQNVEISTK